MAVPVPAPVRRHAPQLAVADASQLGWLLRGLALGFCVPFVFTEIVELPRDVYYAIWVAAVLAFLAVWLRATFADVRAVLVRNWKPALALGVVAGAVLVAIVLGRDATSRPQGWELAGAVLWRGAVYGIADGLFLSVFPILAVYAMFGAPPFHGLPRRRIAALGALALAASLVFTAVYHVGYRDFRNGKLRQPLAGDVVWSLPTLLTAAPLGAPLAHAALHVGAVVHSYDTDLFLPPHAASTGTALAASQRLLQVHVYFMWGEHGAVVHRNGPARAPATTAVRALLRGPKVEEREHGLTTCVPSGTRLLGLTVRNGLATVDLSKRFESGGGSASMFGRLGELVYTLTAVPGVRLVSLRLEGKLVRVFSGEGLILDQPLSRASVRDFVP